MAPPNPAQLRAHKDKAAEYLGKGKPEEALREFCKAVELSPQDLSLRQRIGEILTKIGRPEDAVNVYRFVTFEYARQGHVLKAIAVCKLILNLDKNNVEMQNLLAKLYANRKEASPFDSGRVSAPASATAGRKPAVTAAKPAAGYGGGGMGSGLPGGMKSAGRPGANRPPEEIDIEITEEDAEFFRLANEAEASPPPGPVPVSAETDAAIRKHGSSTDLADLDTFPFDLDSLPPIPLFSSMNSQAFVAAIGKLRLYSFRKDDTIVREGDRGSALYIIVQGRVAVVREKDRGEHKPLAVLDRGAFFGEMALIAESPRLVSAVALEDTVVLELRRADLEEIGAAYPGVIEVVERFYRARLLANLLQCSPVFQPFSRNEKQQLVEAFKSRTVSPGIDILQQGQQGQGFFVLFRGECDVIRADSGGTEHAYGKLHEGDVFGEISLILKEPVTATVRSRTESVLLYLSPEQFDRFVMSHPEVRETIRKLKDQRLSLTVDFLSAIDEPLDSYML